MKQLTTYLSQANLTQVRMLLAILSLLLSVMAFYRDALMNSDGILYMDMAEAYLSGGLAATAKLYNWPFFSILVAWIHQISGLALERVAQIINIVFFVVFTDAILLVSSRILENSKQLIIAAIFILCFITLNDYRPYIIRDMGYWAMILLSLYFMMKFIERPRWTTALNWQLVTALAFLFRIEAIAFFMLLPLATLTQFPIRQALKNSLKLYSGGIVVASIAAGLFLHQHGLTSAFGKVDEVIHFLNFEQIIERFNHHSNVLATEVLSPYAEDDSGTVLASGLIFMFLMKVLTGLSMSYIGVYLYSLYKAEPARMASRGFHPVLIHFAIINIIVLLTFLFSSYFVSTRYVVVLLVALLIMMLPRLSQFVVLQLERRHYTSVCIVGVILILGLVDSMTSSVTKGYIKETAIWASQHLPENSTAVTDDIFIKYYFNANHPKAELTYSKKLRHTKHFDYIILIEKLKDRPYPKAITSSGIIFHAENERGDRATIYKIENAR